MERKDQEDIQFHIQIPQSEKEGKEIKWIKTDEKQAQSNQEQIYEHLPDQNQDQNHIHQVDGPIDTEVTTPPRPVTPYQQIHPTNMI